MIYDPFAQLLEAVDPIATLSDAELDAMFAPVDLLERIQTKIANERVSWLRRRPWRRTTIITLSTVLVLAGSAAAISLLRSSAHDTSRLSCFSSDKVSIDARVYGFSSDPLAACHAALNWKTVPASPDSSGSLCVLANGSLAGFPPSREANVCARLGLASFNGRLKSPELARFDRAAQVFFIVHPCVTPSRAQTEVLKMIGQYGIVQWHVQTTGSTSRGACATLNIQVMARIVNIVGIVK
jgi:hypothetical protein